MGHSETSDAICQPGGHRSPGGHHPRPGHQVMGMLRLASEIQQQILTTPDTIRRPPVTERMLRPIRAIADHRDQLRKFHNLFV